MDNEMETLDPSKGLYRDIYAQIQGMTPIMEKPKNVENDMQIGLYRG